MTAYALEERLRAAVDANAFAILQAIQCHTFAVTRRRRVGEYAYDGNINVTNPLRPAETVLVVDDDVGLQDTLSATFFR